MAENDPNKGEGVDQGTATEVSKKDKVEKEKTQKIKNPKQGLTTEYRWINGGVPKGWTLVPKDRIPYALRRWPQCKDKMELVTRQV